MKARAVLAAAAFLTACGGGNNPQAGPFPTPLVRFIYATTAGNNAVFLYSGTTGGNVSPVQTLSGSNTQLDNPAGITVHGDALYVANAGGSITIYPAFTGGNLRPTNFIRGNITQLTGPSMIAVDSTGDIFVTNNGARNAGGVDSIVAFAPTAAVNVYPSEWIAGTVTRLSQPNGIALDANGDIFVANTGNDTVTAYAPVYTKFNPANVAPFMILGGSSTGLNAPVGLAIDSSGRLWVGNRGNDTLEIFAPNAFGNARPIFTIAGAATLLAAPQEISFDSFGQLDVANADTDAGSIAVFGVLPFPFPPSSNIAPQLQIAGPSTQLTGLIGVAAQ